MAVNRTCWPETYFNRRNQQTDLKEVVEELEKYHTPRPSEIVERLNFHSRNRQEGEGVAAYVAGLRKLSEHRNFFSNLKPGRED